MIFLRKEARTWPVCRVNQALLTEIAAKICGGRIAWVRLGAGESCYFLLRNWISGKLLSFRCDGTRSSPLTVITTTCELPPLPCWSVSWLIDGPLKWKPKEKDGKNCAIPFHFFFGEKIIWEKSDKNEVNRKSVTWSLALLAGEL